MASRQDFIQKGFSQFKNAPFPRLEKMTDLMVGTEGQLGVITEAEFQVVDVFHSRIFFVKLPKWEKSFQYHNQIFKFSTTIELKFTNVTKTLVMQ